MMMKVVEHFLNMSLDFCFIYSAVEVCIWSWVCGVEVDFKNCSCCISYLL